MISAAKSAIKSTHTADSTALTHCEIWKSFQSNSKAYARTLQNLIVASYLCVQAEASEIIEGVEGALQQWRGQATSLDGNPPGPG